MKNNKKLALIYSIPMFCLGIINLVYGILGISGVEIPHTVRAVIALLQVILGVAVIATVIIFVIINRKNNK